MGENLSLLCSFWIKTFFWCEGTIIPQPSADEGKVETKKEKGTKNGNMNKKREKLMIKREKGEVQYSQRRKENSLSFFTVLKTRKKKYQIRNMENSLESEKNLRS